MRVVEGDILVDDLPAGHEDEVTEWLADTGRRKVAMEMLAGPARLIVATTA